MKAIEMCIVLLFTTQAASDSEPLREATFQVITAPQLNMINLTAGSTDSYPLSCASHCLMLDGTCHSFSFNKNTKMCTLGSWVQPSNQLRTQDDGVLYTKGMCNTTAGFHVALSKTISACLYLSDTRETYDVSREICEARGGHLATMKSTQKVSLIKNFVSVDERIRIGLDDQANEGVFKWHDDGSVLTSQQKSQLFADGEPNANSEKNCVYFIRTHSKPLYDYYCGIQHHFLCEISAN